MEKTSKASSSSRCGSKKDSSEIKDIAVEKIKQGFDELETVVKDLKMKYETADDKTKKKVIAGVAGAAAILGGIIAGKAISKKIKK